jgi:GTP-binding protein
MSTPPPVTPIPKIALVGRPNVGKSTLFNRIAGRRKAIVDSRPGSTRDRNYTQASWQGAAFELVDTGGLLLGSPDPLLGPAAAQAGKAIEEADLVIFVVDARAGYLPDDGAIAAQIRRASQPVIVAVNKVEGRADWAGEFERLGFEHLMPISAEHGQGVGDLLDAALADLPRVELPDAEKPLRVALVGRPNVGKSSILNRLLGEDRALVSAIPGTTRDAVDSLLERGGHRYTFVDTAGIRRNRLLKENVDHVSVVQSRRSIDRCDVAILVVDPTEGLREMDATIGGYIQEAGRAVVIAVNKWDLAPELQIKQKAFEQDVRDELKFLPFARVIPVSAQSGKGMDTLLSAVRKAHQSSLERITTGELNRLLGKAVEATPPRATRGHKALKILYGSQIGVQPPTFVLQLSQPDDLHFSYKRYLENQIRRVHPFEGSPIVIKTRARKH